MCPYPYRLRVRMDQCRSSIVERASMVEHPGVLSVLSRRERKNCKTIMRTMGKDDQAEGLDDYAEEDQEEVEEGGWRRGGRRSGIELEMQKIRQACFAPRAPVDPISSDRPLSTVCPGGALGALRPVRFQWPSEASRWLQDFACPLRTIEMHLWIQ